MEIEKRNIDACHIIRKLASTDYKIVQSARDDIVNLKTEEEIKLKNHILECSLCLKTLKKAGLGERVFLGSILGIDFDEEVFRTASQ